MKTLLCEFGKAVKMRLIETGQTQKWLTEQVCEKTGLYFDGYYLHRVLVGDSKNPKVLNAIKEVLEMEEV